MIKTEKKEAASMVKQFICVRYIFDNTEEGKDACGIGQYACAAICGKY